MPTSNPVFKFNRDIYMVKVDNIAQSVSRNEVAELFTGLIGDLHSCEEISDAGRRHFILSFHNQDAAKKALCMGGYTVAGLPLNVTASAPTDTHRPSKYGKHADDRRNLYVLGLPFDLTKTEFVEIFSRYGTVSHAVILATVDNVSRRRGFVVMSSHNEAKVVMDAMNRQEIKGHTIDISWAVVQRSHGFLDGGDRATVIANQSPSPSPSPFVEFVPSNAGPVSLPVSGTATPLSDHMSTAIVSSQSAVIIVKNLPEILFSQEADLHPLFCPFGKIKKLDKLDTSPADAAQGNISVKVEYATNSEAKEARDALDGQFYSNCPVKVEFVQSPHSVMLDVGAMSSAAIDTLQAGLNPRAPPFVVQSGIPGDALFAPVAPVYADPTTRQSQLTATLPARLLTVSPYTISPYAATPNLFYVPVAGALRPSSAPTLWTHAELHSQPGVGLPYSQLQQQFPNTSATSLKLT